MSLPVRFSASFLICCLLLAALGVADAAAETASFFSTGAEQIFVVPAGVAALHVVAIGGRGGAASGLVGSAEGGFGATVTGDLAVTPGQTLYVEVGGDGSPGAGGGGGTGAGGFNGGGAGVGAEGEGLSGGGGGASDLRTLPRANPASLGTRLLVAAGGGGAGGTGGTLGDVGGAGGAAGAPGAAASGSSAGGGGGAASPAGPGSAGAPGGAVGQLGIGGGGGGSSAGGGGGGGGGGLFGGGGGGGSLSGAGGGGGGGSSAGGTVSADATGVPSITITYSAGASQGTGSPGDGSPPPVGSGAPALPRALDTTIRTHPPKSVKTGSKKAKVSFGFSANVAGAAFLCKIDGRPFTGCRSPETFRLPPGGHTFQVKAVEGTTVEATPAKFSFKIRRTSQPPSKPTTG